MGVPFLFLDISYKTSDSQSVMKLGQMGENKSGTLGLITAFPSPPPKKNPEGKLSRVVQDLLFSGIQARRDGGFVKGVMANWPGDDAE